MTKSIPTKRQVIAALQASIKADKDWYEIHHDGSLHSARCKELALQVVKEWKPKKGVSR